jgi:hypothetical protein
VVTGGLLAFGLVLGLSLWLVPLSLNTTWLNRCILSFAGHPVPAYNNQSVSGFLARELIPGNLSWEPQTPTSEFKLASNISLLLYVPVFVMLFLGLKTSRTVSMLLLEFFIVLACSMLTSPISWTHYFMMLLIPAAFYLANDELRSKRVWVNVLFWIGLMLISSPVNVTKALFEQTRQEVFLSLHFMGAVLFYVCLLVVWIDVYRKSGQQVAAS